MATSSALTCQQLVELVTDYLENALSQGDQRRFEEHLAACPHCTAYLQQMRTTIAATGRLTEESLPAGARDELLAVFREWSTTR